MLCRYFWLSDKNKINQNKSSSTSLPTINHHQPTSSSWSSLWSWSLRTLLFTDVDECSDKIHVCDVNAKCTNTNGSHNCTCTDGYIGDGQSCQGTLITILITTWVHKNMFNNELNDCQTKLPLIHHFRYRWMQQWKPCVMWMQTVLTLVALTTAPETKATLGMEDVAKVHFLTFITIFECIFCDAYVSFGAF